MQNRILSLVRGDTLIIPLDVKDAWGKDLLFAENDKVYMDIKKRVSDAEPVLHKEFTYADVINIGTMMLEFTSQETELLEAGEYVYDVRAVLDQNGSTMVQTIIPLSKLFVVAHVTTIPKEV